MRSHSRSATASEAGPADRSVAPPLAGAPAILAVDGGNSKTDVALVTAAGELLAAVRGPTTSHQAVGLDRGMAALDRLVDAAAAAAGRPGIRPAAVLGVYSLAGADYPSDLRVLRPALRARRLADEDVVLNDTVGALRAGTRRPWGVVLICGQGVNGAGIAPGGRTARFAAVGDISGDWGGGHAVGLAGQAAAVRARDGRGPRTSLERLVPAHFGLRTPEALTRAFYEGRIPERRAAELAPVVFAAAGDGDRVARSIVDRLADELVVMGGAILRRLRLRRLDPDVVLAGGVFRTDDAAFSARLDAGIRAVAPKARLVPLTAPPVLGAALLGLDRLAGGAVHPAVEERLRADFAAWRPERDRAR